MTFGSYALVPAPLARPLRSVSCRSALLALALMAVQTTAVDAAPKKHSKVEITDSAASCSKDKAKKERVLNVKVIPDKGLVVNTDGYWKLTVQNPKGLTVAKPNLVKADFDKDLPGFKLPVSCTADKGSFDYQIMAFVCTKDKKLCYFDRHEGSHSI